MSDKKLDELTKESERLDLYGHRVKWYERAPGNTSAMRIIAMVGSVTGAAAILAGIIVVTAAVVAMFLCIPEAVQMASQGVAIAAIGGGMAGLGEVAKAWQSKGER